MAAFLLCTLLAWRAAAVQVGRNLGSLQWDSPEAALQSCSRLASATKLGAGISVSPGAAIAQNELVRSGDHIRTMQAMRDYPSDLGVQRACSTALSNAAQWNQANSAVLGDAGAVETLVESLKRFPKEQADLLGQLGAFCDYVEENRARLRRAGGLEAAFRAAESAHSADVQGALMCLVSTQYTPPENFKAMVDLGLVHKLVQGMKDFPTAPMVRGESIWNAATVLIRNNASLIPELVREGFVPELLKAMRDEPAMHARRMSFDPLGQGGSEIGMLRMYSTAFGLLGTIARADASYLDAAPRSGAVEEIARALEAVGHLEGTMPWGQHMSLVESACPALATLTQGDASRKGQAQVQTRRRAGFVAQVQGTVRGILSKKPLAPAAHAACREFLSMSF